MALAIAVGHFLPSIRLAGCWLSKWDLNSRECHPWRFICQFERGPAPRLKRYLRRFYIYFSSFCGGKRAPWQRARRQTTDDKRAARRRGGDHPPCLPAKATDRATPRVGRSLAREAKTGFGAGRVCEADVDKDVDKDVGFGVLWRRHLLAFSRLHSGVWRSVNGGEGDVIQRPVSPCLI